MGIGLWRATIIARTNPRRSARILLRLTRFIKRGVIGEDRKKGQTYRDVDFSGAFATGRVVAGGATPGISADTAEAYESVFAFYFDDENFQQAEQVAQQWCQSAETQVATRAGEMQRFFSRYADELAAGRIDQIQLARRQERRDRWNANSQRGPHPDSIKEGTRDFKLIWPVSFVLPGALGFADRALDASPNQPNPRRASQNIRQGTTGLLGHESNLRG